MISILEIKNTLNRLLKIKLVYGLSILILFIGLIVLLVIVYLNLNKTRKLNINLNQNLTNTTKLYTDLKNQDQIKINADLQLQIKNIQTTYTDSIDTYQKILDLQIEKQNVSDLTALYAKLVKYLADINYASASATLKVLQTQIENAQTKFTASQVPAASAVNVTVSNTAPQSGFSVQQVQTPGGTFTVYLVAADLNSTRVIVDTASEADCANNCPALPLSDYISRSGAYAGINGTFFCPADYPACAGKSNSFDTLLMNKNKVYLNSSNNVYSSVPLVYFSGNSMGVRTASSNWGRDTGVDSVIAMQPLLILDNNIVYSGSDDPKFGSKGPRGFIGNIGSTVYIGDVLNANMSDSANVLHTLGLNNALNLDEGGSTALWDGGHKLGPGRNIPNAILFVKK